MESVAPVADPTAIPSAPRSAEEQAQLREAAREFEALLLQMLLKAMRATVPESPLFGDSNELKMYEELRDENLARAMAGGPRLGLARAIERQLGQDPAGMDRLQGALQGARESGVRARVLDAAPLSTLATKEPS